jgi:hypothetical protein
MEPVELSSQPPRSDFTDREISQILGALVGGLVMMVDDPAAVRRAVQWWAVTDEPWMIVEAARGLKAAASRAPS